MRHIVTHPGRAHRDDLLACSIALALEEGCDRVWRREPTSDEIQDPSVLVLDVGGDYNPDLGNFDHHQMERGTRECALSLYLRARGLEDAFKLLPWYNVTVLMDSNGPFVTGKELGLPRFPMELLSPVEEVLLEKFGEKEEIRGDFLEILRNLGQSLLDKALAARERIEFLRNNIRVVEVRGIKALLLEDKSTALLQEYRDSVHPDAGLSLMWDDRGEGWTIYRFNDHKAVDLSRLEGDQRVLFAHKGGFIAKTRQRVPMEELVEIASMGVIS